MQTTTTREAILESPNPLGLDGIEFIEFSTNRPQAIGQVLEMLGFCPIARHRSREVLCYRQGLMNLIINAHSAAPVEAAPLEASSAESPRLAAIGLRVRDAGAAYRRAIDLGAWAVPTGAAAMELSIPTIHGVGGSRIYFIDRYRDFSIFDIDFVPIPNVDPRPPALAGLHWFGLVQYIGPNRMLDWIAFYQEVLGCVPLPDQQRFGILPKGTILASPCGNFYLQLIEPEGDLLDVEHVERLQRIGFGVADVPAAVKLLRSRGIEWLDAKDAASAQRGALSRAYLGDVMFELVHDPRG